MILSLQAPPVAPAYDERASLHRLRWVFFALGLAAVIVGILAISFAFIATMAKVIVFGVLLLIAGITEVLHAFMVRRARSFALHLLAAALYLLVGLFMLEDPERAAAVLTLLLAAYFIVGGVLRVVFSLGADFPGWPWVLLNGVVDLILGTLIWSGWPESSLWVLGLFLGIDLILHGWSWMALALVVPAYNVTPPAEGSRLAGSADGPGAGAFRA
jgi:uncharacterized membrane protein HdeD (DUF308 family)